MVHSITSAQQQGVSDQNKLANYRISVGLEDDKHLRRLDIGHADAPIIKADCEKLALGIEAEMPHRVLTTRDYFFELA